MWWFSKNSNSDCITMQSFQLVALSKLYMKLDCKHLLIMRLSGEASFEAKDRVIHWLMLIQWRSMTVPYLVGGGGSPRP